jgi:hypothetical protein
MVLWEAVEQPIDVPQDRIRGLGAMGQDHVDEVLRHGRRTVAPPVRAVPAGAARPEPRRRARLRIARLSHCARAVESPRARRRVWPRVHVRPAQTHDKPDAFRAGSGYVSTVL